MLHVPFLLYPEIGGKTDFEKVLFPIRIIPKAINKYFYARPIIEKNDSELFILGLSEMKSKGDIEVLASTIVRLKIQLRKDKVRFQTGYCPYKEFPDIVLKEAKDAGIDLLILTANFENDLKSFFIGPFVQKVIHHSRIPVLSIKPAYKQSNPGSSYKVNESMGKKKSSNL